MGLNMKSKKFLVTLFWLILSANFTIVLWVHPEIVIPVEVFNMAGFCSMMYIGGNVFQKWIQNKNPLNGGD